MIRRLRVRILLTQPASAVSDGHVQTKKITVTFPRLSRREASLCSPNFRQSSQGRGTLGASLCSRNFNFQIANPETRFELARDWFVFCNSNASVDTTAPLDEMSCAVRKERPLMDPWSKPIGRCVQCQELAARDDCQPERLRRFHQHSARNASGRNNKLGANPAQVVCRRLRPPAALVRNLLAATKHTPCSANSIGFQLA